MLQQETVADLRNPVTIDLEDTIYDALSLMFENNFSQLPVMSGGDVVGVVTYKSISRVAKSVPETDLQNMSVKGGTVTPEFVNEDQDIFDLFDTFAVDEYVLIGSKENLAGILTRYDVFHFLKRQFKPFIQIGEIERSLRYLFRDSIENLDERIEQTFEPRTNDDPSYSVPDTIDHLNFEEYKRFIVKNIDSLPQQMVTDEDFILELLEAVRENRNALFHFRASVDEIDRESLDVAHSYFTGLVE